MLHRWSESENVGQRIAEQISSMKIVLFQYVKYLTTWLCCILGYTLSIALECLGHLTVIETSAQSIIFLTPGKVKGHLSTFSASASSAGQGSCQRHRGHTFHFSQ